MTNQIASLSLSITALLASSLLQTTAARAQEVKPTTISKVCTSEVISNPIIDKLDAPEPVSDKIDGAESVSVTVTGKFNGAEQELSKASDSSNPKLMQKPGKDNKQPCRQI